MAAPPGIYVEIRIRTTLDELWRLTQQPGFHQRWDLRFTHIHYLPRRDPDQPQQFLYETRIGFGLAIRGTGESVGTCTLPDGSATSALKFASNDPKSLIREGSGYWRYIPIDSQTSPNLRFLTWYDYRVRFGPLGSLFDRLAFRPLIGWATAWSFDRLRLWAETGQPPEASLTLAATHALSRLAVAFIWIWHGLVPKLLFRHADERLMLTQAGIPLDLLPWIGAAELLFGLALLLPRSLLLLSAAAMVIATAAVALKSPAFLTAAFNPITLDLAVAALSLIAWLTSRNLPSSRNCLRTQPTSQEPSQP